MLDAGKHLLLCRPGVHDDIIIINNDVIIHSWPALYAHAHWNETKMYLLNMHNTLIATMKKRVCPVQ